MKNFFSLRPCFGRVLNSTFKTAMVIAGIVLASFSVNAQCDLGEDYYYIGSYNGNDYYVSFFGSYAADASAIAAAAGGHLATIADAAENALVAAGAGGLAWIGFNDVAVEGTFVWETGEPVTYTNWCPFEPNNCCPEFGGEQWTTTNWCGFGEWNDLFDGSEVGAYYLPLVVEIEFEDDDCDGVANCNDVCPGGNDNGPCNATSLPSNLPASWYCSNNPNSVKVKICHNGQTLCVSANAVPAHLAHGDFLGPCSSCGSGYAIATENPIADQDHVKPVMDIYPNPSNGDFKVLLKQPGTGSIRVLDQNGRIIRNFKMENRSSTDVMLLEPGIYVIQYVTDKEMITQKIAVNR